METISVEKRGYFFIIYKLLEKDENGNVVNESLHATFKGCEEHLKCRQSVIFACDMKRSLMIERVYIDE